VIFLWISDSRSPIRDKPDEVQGPESNTFYLVWMQSSSYRSLPGVRKERVHIWCAIKCVDNSKCLSKRLSFSSSKQWNAPNSELPLFLFKMPTYVVSLHHVQGTKHSTENRNATKTTDLTILMSMRLKIKFQVVIAKSSS